MQGVTGVVAVREDKRLLALALSPPVYKQWRVPVDFVEDMRGVDVAFRAILLLTRSSCTAGPRHVIFVIVEASSGVITRRKVDVGTKRGGIAITVHVWKACTGTFVVGILQPDAVHTV